MQKKIQLKNSLPADVEQFTSPFLEDLDGTFENRSYTLRKTYVSELFGNLHFT